MDIQLIRLDRFISIFHIRQLRGLIKLVLAIKKVFHGYPIDQVGPTYYNIPHPSTQGTNQTDTSRQEATPADNDDV